MVLFTHVCCLVWAFGDRLRAGWVITVDTAELVTLLVCATTVQRRGLRQAYGCNHATQGNPVVLATEALTTT